MKTLHLTLKKQWFDMIASGEKKEEYREFKSYWCKRLQYEHFDTVTFRNGYSKDAPTVVVEFLGLDRGFGKSEWGAPENEKVFIIRLGRIVK